METMTPPGSLSFVSSGSTMVASEIVNDDDEGMVPAAAFPGPDHQMLRMDPGGGPSASDHQSTPSFEIV
jgi:hypothetical protein